MRRTLVYTLLLMVGLLPLILSSCSSTKSIPDGEYLYLGAKIDYGPRAKEATREMKREVEAALSPKPNSRILGVPLRLYLYQLFDNGKDKGLIAWARKKLGQAPVMFNREYPPQVAEILENRMTNTGFFHSSAYAQVDTSHQKARITYHLNFGQAYQIDTIEYRVQQDALSRVLDSLPPSVLLKPGAVYTLSGLQQETGRIERYLKEHGYYYFSRNYLKFQADTSLEDHLVNLRLMLRDNVPMENLRRMTIRKVDIYPDHSVMDKVEEHTRTWGGMVYHFPPKERFAVKPLAHHILFRPGDLYNITYHYNTLSRLVGLNSLSYVNTQYTRLPETDSIDMLISLTPRKSQNLQGSIGLSYKNSQYIGPDLEVSYTHRNLFRGSEQLKVKVYTNLNFPTRPSEFEFYEKSGFDVDVTVPDLKIPFYRDLDYKSLSRTRTIFTLKYQRERVRFPAKAFVPLIEAEDQLPEIEAMYPQLEGLTDYVSGLHTVKDELDADSSYAPFVGINSIEFSLGYQWRKRPEITHQLTPVALGLQLGTFEDPEMLAYLTALFLVDGAVAGKTPLESIEPLIQLEDMVYWNPGYVFLFDSREKAIRKNNYFYRGGLAFLGNSEFGTQTYAFTGIDQFRSFFIQSTNDGRYFGISRDGKRTIATRLVVDVAYPFSDVLFLPFFSFFTVAGPNSVRAYNQQELGPGSTKLTEEQSSFLLFAGKGNMHVESSIEYRVKIAGMFEYAAFVDVGNVWVINSSTEAANFRFNKFYKELGLGVGMGLRLNINPLVLRVDLAIPLTKPWLPEGERWVGNQIELGYPSWRRENLQWNIAFGYPF